MNIKRLMRDLILLCLVCASLITGAFAEGNDEEFTFYPEGSKGKFSSENINEYDMFGGALKVPPIKPQPTALTVFYKHLETPIPGANFKIYRVANVDFAGRFYVTKNFASYGLDFDHNDQADWEAMARLLKQNVQKDGINYEESGTTKIDGKCAFDLTPGLYLVIGNQTVIGDYMYTCEPTLVFLPFLDAEDNEWVYEARISPKGENGGPPDVKINLKVMKVWKDFGYKDKQPKEVEVELLRNGKVFSQVSLSDENNWRYTWENLPAFDGTGKIIDWYLDEVYEENYFSEVTREGMTFIVTNTYTGELPPGDPTPLLPNTGLLWWPVPVLAGLGALFIFLSTVKRRKAEE